MCSQDQAIGELAVRSSRLTCARRKSSNSSRKQHSQCLAAATVTRVVQYSKAAGPQQQVCECRAAVRGRQGWRSVALLLYCLGRARVVANGGPREMIAWRVAWGQGVCEDTAQSNNDEKKGERMEAAVVWQPVVVVVGRSVFSSSSFFTTDRARQGVVAHRVWCGEVEAAPVH